MKRVFVFYFNLLWNQAKFWVFLSIILALVTGVVPIVTLWITKETVNEVSDIISSKDHEISYFIRLLIVQFIILVSHSLIKNWHQLLTEKVKIKLDFYLKKVIFNKITSVPYFYFDLTDFYNHHNRIKNNPAQYFTSLLEKGLNVCSAFITLASMVAFLFHIHWVLMVISFISAIPVLIFQSYFGNMKFFMILKQTPKAREISYIEHLFNNRESIKEIRIGNTTDFLLKKWANRYRENAIQALTLFKKQQFGNIGLDAISAILFSVAAYIIVLLTKTRSLKIGDFVSIGQAITNTQQALNMLSFNMAKIYEDYLYINDYYLFLHFSCEKYADKKTNHINMNLNQPFHMKVDNISFKYINSNKNAINNMSFEIEPGETVAIVGENGSGKSTLIKCLLGLYHPTEGRIYYDNVDSRLIPPQIIYKKMAVLFQEFIKYPFSLAENITCGEDEAYENFFNIYDQLGINSFVSDLSDGYDTYLGKFLYDGDDISGGQWQKVALARNLIKKNAEVFIFDEPTSALDPISEQELFKKIKSLTNGKTVIFISHQMAASKSADKIIVLKNGGVEEVGTHHELLLNEGEYYSLYSSQAKWFNEKSEVVQN
jgi:putative ABC transport system ATP-binding protein/ATP-binding cassette subfamily B protein